MLGPIIIVGLGVISIFRGQSKKQGVMTPERNHLYQSALKSKVLSPEQYEKLAAAFEKEGLSAEAVLLRKRAKLRAMTSEQKEARKQVFRKALASKDPQTVETLAAIYEAQGATGSAKTLRMVAIGLRNAQGVKPVNVAPSPPSEVVNSAQGVAAAQAAQDATPSVTEVATPGPNDIDYLNNGPSAAPVEQAHDWTAAGKAVKIAEEVAGIAALV